MVIIFLPQSYIFLNMFLKRRKDYEKKTHIYYSVGFAGAFRDTVVCGGGRASGKYVV
jgi:hypothetical protein